MDYDVDYLIVGAGLAGLHTALHLAKRYSRESIVVAEAYHYFGGRVVTHTPHMRGRSGLHWENGAGRIHSSHKRVLDLVKKYDLTLFPISQDQQWVGTDRRTYENTWDSLFDLMKVLLSRVSHETLAHNTIAELLGRIMGPKEAEKLLVHFPYRSETHVMRADMALQSLSKELGQAQQHFVVKEGLSALVKGLVHELEGLGVEFMMGHRLYGLPHDQVAEFKVDGKDRVTLRAKKIILALHSTALQQIPPFRNHPFLKKIRMEPLLRIYAVFPVTQGRSWFSDMHHSVTDSPLRYIIPIDPAKGVIMISYTDSFDTKRWNRILALEGADALQAAVMQAVRRLFPQTEIPDPLFFKAHPWTEGCSYWTPGSYDPYAVSQKVMHPLPTRYPNVYVCGESFSYRHQCWMEGALEHAEQLCKQYFSSSM